MARTEELTPDSFRHSVPRREQPGPQDVREVQRDLLPDLLRDSPRTLPGDLRCDVERDDRRSGLAASDPFAGVASTARGAHPRPLTTSTPTRTGDPRELLLLHPEQSAPSGTAGGPPRPQGRRGSTTGAYRLVRTPPGSVDPPLLDAAQRRWLTTPAVRCWSSPGRAPARPPRSSRRSPPASPGAATRPASSCSPSAARPRWSCATGWPPGSAAARGPQATTFHSFCYALVRAHQDADLFAEPLRLLSGPEQDVTVRDLLAGQLELEQEGLAHIRWPDELRACLTTRGFADEVRAVLARSRELGLGPDALADFARRTGRPDWAAAADFLAEYLDVLDAAGGTGLRGAGPPGGAPRRAARGVARCWPASTTRSSSTSTRTPTRRRCGCSTRWPATGGWPGRQRPGPGRVRRPGPVDLRLPGRRCERHPRLPGDVPAGGRRPGPGRRPHHLAPLRRTAAGRHPAAHPPDAADPPAVGEGARPPRARRGPRGRPGGDVHLPDRVHRARQHRRPAAPRPSGGRRAVERDGGAGTRRRPHDPRGAPRPHLGGRAPGGRRRRPPAAPRTGGGPAPDGAAHGRHGGAAPHDDYEGRTAGSGRGARDPDRPGPRRGSARPDPVPPTSPPAPWLDTETALTLLASPLGGMDAADLRRLGRALRDEERAAGNRVPAPSDVLLARALAEPERLVAHDPAYARGAQRLGALLRKARELLEGGGTAEEALWELWDGTPWPGRLETGRAARRRRRPQRRPRPRRRLRALRHRGPRRGTHRRPWRAQLPRRGRRPGHRRRHPHQRVPYAPTPYA